MSTYYVDCEFDGHNGPLLSIALVRDDTISLYLTTDHVAQDPWVVENVVPIMGDHKADVTFEVGLNQVGAMIRAFIKETSFTVITDSPVDVGRFCQAINTDNNGQWISTGYESINFKVLNVDAYPTTLEGAVQHNAWWDAMALMEKLNG